MAIRTTRRARKLLYLIGVNGAGKSTLARRIAAAAREAGITVHVDSEQVAFDPAVDRALQPLPDALARSAVLTRARQLVECWRTMPAELIVVDRWIESYDVVLEQADVDTILAQLAVAGIALHPVHLVVGADERSDDIETMVERTRHNRAHRSEEWWALGEGSEEDRAAEECAYQAQYRRFSAQLPSAITICTTVMDWDAYEAAIATQLSLVPGGGPVPR